MDWKIQISNIVLTALLTAILTNLASYLREKKIRNDSSTFKNKEEAINKIFKPIYTILSKELYTAKGYDGLDLEQITQIKGLIDSFPENCPRELTFLVNSLYEDSIRLNDMAKLNGEDPVKVDDKKKLFNYVEEKFNSFRKEVGMITE